MKRLLSLIFLVCLLSSSAIAAPWGLTDNYSEESTSNEQTVKNYKYYAMYKLLTGSPVRYTVVFEEYPEQTSLSDSIWEKFVFEKIQKAFDRWVDDTKLIINKSGRASEFKDITDILNKGKIKLVRSSKEDADIIFEFVNYKGARFVFNTDNLSERKRIQAPNPAYFDKKEQKKIDNFLLHEVGHYYGLGDRYQEEISASSPVNSTTGDTDSDSVMASNLGTRLTCDDAEGFINLMDITLFFINGKYPARSQKGWKGICGNKKEYYQGRERNREDFFDGVYLYTYNADGTIKDKRQVFYPGAYYIPFNNADALKTPFSGIQKVYSDDKTVYTVFNYTDLHKGRLKGNSRIGDISIVDFEGISRNGTWNVVLDYKKYGRYFSHIDKMQVNVNDKGCFYYISDYSYSQNIKSDIATDGSIKANFKAINGNDTFDVSVSGILESEKFTFKNGSFIKEYTVGEEYIIQSDKNMKTEMFIHDVLRSLHKKFVSAKETCKYFSALNKSLE